LVQDGGGSRFQTGGIRLFVEDLKPGSNKDIGPKDFFEMACNKKSTVTFSGTGAFFNAYRLTQSQPSLFALSTLMSRASQQLAVFMFTHFFPAFFDDATQ
jgi:hypothetical protein